MVLGHKQLQRWLRLLLFTLQSDAPYPSPLLMLAATRSKMMELLATKLECSADFCDAAFMAGVLSLIESLINKPLAEIFDELNLDERLSAALLVEKVIRPLLLLVESVEHQDPVRPQSLLDAAGGLSFDALTEVEIQAMSWSNQIAESASA